MRESSTRSVGSRYDWPNEIRVRYCRHVYLHLHLAHNVKDCTLDWIFDTHSPQLKHSHSGKSICDLIVFYCRNVIFLMEMVLSVFQCFPYHQHSGFQLDQHSSQFVVPPLFLFLHATPCRARYFHRMEILRSIFLCPRRVGASASPNSLMVFRKLRPNFGPRDEFYCEADSI